MHTIYFESDTGSNLALADDLDAIAFWQFGRVRDAMSFIAEHVGTTGYRYNDDCVIVPEMINTFTARDEFGRDLTDEYIAAMRKRGLRVGLD